MKKYLITLVLALGALASNAQLYKSIEYYDKFDDVIKTEQRKTLITKTDSSTLIIEEKGKKPVEYYILNEVPDGTRGTKDEPVNLVANLYGYETTWCMIRYELLDEYLELHTNYLLNPTKTDIEKLKHYWIFAVHRTVTTQYSGAYLDDIFWLQDDDSDGKLGKDVNRIIYQKD